jgi:DNA-binding MarR family transcriptional regulator
VLFDVWLDSRATHALIDDAVHASGLDADEFAIYSVLASTDEMTPTDLARWMSAPATTVSSYVRRDPNPDDGRSYRVALTVAGRRVHAEAGELFGPVLDEITRRLGDDVLETH